MVERGPILIRPSEKLVKGVDVTLIDSLPEFTRADLVGTIEAESRQLTPFFTCLRQSMLKLYPIVTSTSLIKHDPKRSATSHTETNPVGFLNQNLRTLREKLSPPPAAKKTQKSGVTELLTKRTTDILGGLLDSVGVFSLDLDREITGIFDIDILRDQLTVVEKRIAADLALGVGFNDKERTLEAGKAIAAGLLKYFKGGKMRNIKPTREHSQYVWNDFLQALLSFDIE